mmetsp:Transcript_5662/g.15017  ORF Transcript_5662/g.15017 Transcript_5662/m.15017 type:complete len:266 (+) Transcript_5662:223-1020(+)
MTRSCLGVIFCRYSRNSSSAASTSTSWRTVASSAPFSQLQNFLVSSSDQVQAGRTPRVVQSHSSERFAPARSAGSLPTRRVKALILARAAPSAPTAAGRRGSVPSMRRCAVARSRSSSLLGPFRPSRRIALRKAMAVMRRMNSSMPVSFSESHSLIRLSSFSSSFSSWVLSSGTLRAVASSCMTALVSSSSCSFSFAAWSSHSRMPPGTSIGSAGASSSSDTAPGAASVPTSFAPAALARSTAACASASAAARNSASALASASAR